MTERNLEKFKQNLEAYNNIVDYYSQLEKTKSRANLLYGILEDLKKDADLFRSATNTYRSAIKLITKINQMGLENIVKESAN